MAEDLTKSRFETIADKRFRVGSEGGHSIEVELIEVSPLATDASVATEGQRAAFSLLFRGPAATPLAQGTYLFEHSEVGKIELFIVPVGEDDAGRSYEAIFS